MSKWNYQFYENFKQAAQELGYEITPDWHYFKMEVPGLDVWLWTPLNKMRSLINEEDPVEALRFMKNNQDDFHLEVNKSCGYGIDYLFPELDNPSVKDIVSAVKTALDPVALAELEMMYKLTYGDEE